MRTQEKRVQNNYVVKEITVQWANENVQNLSTHSRV